jgi:ATP adenylyltransferase
LPIIKQFFTFFGNNSRMLFRSSSYFVVPSVGALVRGHVLLVPKSHYYSVGEIPEPELREFEFLVSRVRTIILNTFGSCSAFEHGCVQGSGKGGACIDHAHLHLLPFPTDLGSQISRNFGPGVDIQSYSDLRQFVNKRVSYLYYEAPDGAARAFVAPLVPSQYFRQLIFATDRRIDNWDWRRDPRLSVVMGTYTSLLEAFSHLEEQSANGGVGSALG